MKATPNLKKIKMKILVTGGAGFIGANLALELEKQGHEITIVDNMFSGAEVNLKGFKGKFIELDVSIEKEIPGEFDVIFHQAAITDPRHDNDEETYTKNVQGFKNILKLAQKNNAKLIYASTAALYGNGPIPMKENQELKSFSAYAESKIKMDQIAAGYFDKMHIVGLRYFNVFGPRESHKGRPASMIYHLRKQMLNKERPKLFKFGEQKRDHIYVKDAVRANILALDAKSGVYNVGTGIATTFNEVVKILNEVLGTALEPEYIDNPYGEDYQENTQADTTKAENILGFKAEYSFKQGVADYHNYLKENGI